VRDDSPGQGRPEGDPPSQESRPDAGPSISSSEPLLRVEDLRVEFPTEDGVVHAVDGVSYEVDRGRTLGIVGESGSGKTVSSLTTLGLTRAQGAQVSGRILFEGKDLVALPEKELRAIRGNDIAMIFQDPLSSLHPFFKVGAQLIEAVRVHQDVSKQAARARAIELLGLVGIPDPSERVDAYPHEFSGGMRQRAMIAMALANEPKLLIADEPTTALDVTVQAQILALLQRLQGELGMAIVIITHDLGVVAQTADDIAVMYAGRIVERATTKRLFAGPEHPYTWGLLKSIPSLSGTRKEQLVPISGSPPSLINLPPGCHFHPRCPYSQPDHARNDPQLLPVAEEPSHRVACLLEASVRKRLWAQLSDGKLPEQARASVGLPAPEPGASAADATGDMPEVGL
jgi:peptide/nickel transport system ATP-binding protein